MVRNQLPEQVVKYSVPSEGTVDRRKFPLIKVKEIEQLYDTME